MPGGCLHEPSFHQSEQVQTVGLAVGPVYLQIAVMDPIHAAPDEAEFLFVDRVVAEITGNGISFRTYPEKLDQRILPRPDDMDV